MAIKIADFTVKTMSLFTKDEAEALGVKEKSVPWIRVAPASQADQADRQSTLAMQFNRFGRPLSGYLRQREIMLTFAGTNLEISVPKLDEDGNYSYTEVDGGMVPEFETLSFPATGGGADAQADIAAKLARLPEKVIECWSRRVREVNPQWGSDFRL